MRYYLLSYVEYFRRLITKRKTLKICLSISGGLRPLERPRGELVLQNIHYSYMDAPLIKGVNLHLLPGKSIALVGRSGCGKSTIASLIMRLYDPDKGKILLDGVDIRDLDPVWLRSHIGFVSQVCWLIIESYIIGVRLRIALKLEFEIWLCKHNNLRQNLWPL